VVAVPPEPFVQYVMAIQSPDPHRVEGTRPTRYRTGLVRLAPSGVDVDGHRVLPDGLRTVVTIGLGVTAVGLILAWLLTERSFRFRKATHIAWSSVEFVQCDPIRNRLGIVFLAEDGKRESLVFSLPMPSFAQAVNVIQQEIGGERVREGAFVPSIPTWVVFAVLFGMLVVAAIVIAVMLLRG